jgi:RNA polymerase sigma-70 factor (ECF subfamily)
MEPPESGPHSRLDQISTRWAAVRDPAQFLLRYGTAVRRYLGALVKQPDDVDEILQDFLTRGIERGFVRAEPLRGRFRDYLKTAVRNAALSHLRRRKPVVQGDFALEELAAAPDTPLAADQQWEAEWRLCVLSRAWQALESHERRAPASLCHTVLRLSVAHPEEDSKALAARASAQSGRPIRADAFRKQVSRARRLFAELLLGEVAQTLEDPTPEQIEEELVDVGLMEYVRDFLPPDWRTRGQLTEPEHDPAEQ